MQRCYNKGTEHYSQRLSSSNNNIQENDMMTWKNEIILHVENKTNRKKHKIKP